MDKLEKYRKKIDVIDATIVKLIAKRMRVVEKVGKFKKRNQIAVNQPGRWNEVLNRVGDMAVSTEILDRKLIEDIWNRMHDFAIDLESKN